MPSTQDPVREWLGSIQGDAVIAAIPESHGQPVYEAMMLREAHGDWVNRADAQNWGGSESSDSLAVQASDQAHGDYAPFFRDEYALRAMWAVGRHLATRDNTGVGIMDALTDYTIGTGFTYSATARDEDDSEAEAIAEKAQGIVDEWQECHGWLGGLERELFQSGVRDGEAILYMEPMPGGLPCPRVVASEFVTEPMRSDDGLDWKYGIGTVPNRPERRHAYSVRWYDDLECEEIPARHIAHINFNVTRHQKRGLSDYFAVEMLPLLTKLDRNTVLGATIMAAIAYWVKTPAGTTRAQAETFQREQGTSNGSQMAYGGQRATTNASTRPGAVKYAPQGMDILAGPMGTLGGPVYAEIGAYGKRAVAARWKMPEFMVSSDASNANYASTMVAGSPFVRRIQSRQTEYVKYFRKIMHMVLQSAIVCGKFLRWGIKTIGELLSAIKLDITPPAVAVGEDSYKAAQCNEIYVRMGVKSARTVAEEQDLDFDTEVANGAKAQEVASPVAQLPPGGRAGMPIGGGPSPVAGSGWNGAQSDSVLKVFAGLADGSIAPSVAIGMITEIGTPEEKARLMVSDQQQDMVRQAAAKKANEEAAKAASFGSPNGPPKPAEVRESVSWWNCGK